MSASIEGRICRDSKTVVVCEGDGIVLSRRKLDC